ncbi:MAG: carbon monoxide dehydrogenase medium subunit [Hyphomicrobiales bacterium]|nr:carbon monoxide dehydrogenase medium subunit [Hyphomicrobiales bacterium]
MKPAAFVHHRPTTLEEAVRILAEVAPDDGRVIAGGQSLVPIMAYRMARPPHLVDINHVAGLDRLAVENGRLAIGARVRHMAFRDSAAPGATGALLSTLMRHIAHAPIRTRGTFCGSLAHSDPSSEWCLAAAALDAVLIAHSARGVREIAAADYFQGAMTTDLQPDEILVEARLPLLPDDTRIGFVEFSRRAGDYALASVLTTFRLVGGKIAEPRFAIGGAEAFPRRLAEIETMLTGAAPDADLWREAAERAAAIIDPLEDAATPGDYRRDLVRALTLRAFQQANA